MKSKPKLKAMPEPETGAGAIQATLTFALPAAEEYLELAIQGRKWRQLVQYLALDLSRWRDTATNPEAVVAYRDVNFLLRDYLAELGLTLDTREQLEQSQREHSERHRKHLHALVKKTKAEWGDVLKDGAEAESQA